MKDFSKYEPEKKPADVGGDDLSGQFAKFASAYEGKSGDEMMAEILAEAEKGRRNRTLTDADIDKFAATVSPFLSDKQRRMLATIVKRLKQ